MRVKARRRERSDTNAIRLVLVAARKINLLLCGCALRDRQTGLRGVGVAGSGAEDKRTEHQCRRQNALAAVGMN